ncbi:hypothetical protein K2173_008730 [Erythroxylum novogranatense]|uniref:Bidirectional sugar transporter SWEET n=1 Tax=Erythroxylum novogranatense TaxID=1862640 RepID=A0AAV8SL88_9ROSI|nr:hypothetical protein K2173_008730 [Erythroxylum novogranatense]
MGFLRLTVGILGNVASLSLFSAPIITFTRVIKHKSTEEFSCIPYIISLLDCIVYTWYSTPVVSYGCENLPILTVNGIGTLLELSFIFIYLWFAPRKEKVKVASLTLVVVLLSILVIVVSVFVRHDHSRRKLFVGCAGIVASAVMYGSPLVAVKTVIETESVEFMPFYLSFFTFLSSTLWGIYGLLELDFFIASPSIVGIILSIIQLALYFKYRKRGIKEEPNKWDIEKSEDKSKVELQPG